MAMWQAKDKTGSTQERVGGLDGLEEAPGARDLPQKKWKWVLDDGVRRAPRGVGALSRV